MGVSPFLRILLFVCHFRLAIGGINVQNVWDAMKDSDCKHGTDASGTYDLVDPVNCQSAPCEFDTQHLFCAKIGDGSFACRRWPDSCGKALTPKPLASATTVASGTAATPTITPIAVVPAAAAPSGSDPTPQMPDSAKKYIGSGDSTAVNSKIPLPQKATRDYLDTQKCCEMAMKGNCNINKYYMKVQCAFTCGSVGTDTYDAATSPVKIRPECTPI